MGLVVDVLQGSRSAKVVERKLDRIATHAPQKHHHQAFDFSRSSVRRSRQAKASFKGMVGFFGKATRQGGPHCREHQWCLQNLSSLPKRPGVDRSATNTRAYLLQSIHSLLPPHTSTQPEWVTDFCSPFHSRCKKKRGGTCL